MCYIDCSAQAGRVCTAPHCGKSRTDRSLSSLGGDTQPEADQYRTCHCLDDAAQRGTAQEIADFADHSGVKGEPGKGHCCKSNTQGKQCRKYRSAGRRELRKQAGKEHSHLGIPKIADQPLEKRRPGAEQASRTTCRAGCRISCGRPQGLAKRENNAYKLDPNADVYSLVGAADGQFELELSSFNGADLLLAFGLPPDPSGIVPIKKFRRLVIAARRRHLGQRSAEVETMEVSSPGHMTMIFGGRAEGYIERRLADITTFVPKSVQGGATQTGWG